MASMSLLMPEHVDGWVGPSGSEGSLFKIRECQLANRFMILHNSHGIVDLELQLLWEIWQLKGSICIKLR